MVTRNMSSEAPLACCLHAAGLPCPSHSSNPPKKKRIQTVPPFPLNIVPDQTELDKYSVAEIASYTYESRVKYYTELFYEKGFADYAEHAVHAADSEVERLEEAQDIMAVRQGAFTVWSRIVQTYAEHNLDDKLRDAAFKSCVTAFHNKRKAARLDGEALPLSSSEAEPRRSPQEDLWEAQAWSAAEAALSVMKGISLPAGLDVQSLLPFVSHQSCDRRQLLSSNLARRPLKTQSSEQAVKASTRKRGPPLRYIEGTTPSACLAIVPTANALMQPSFPAEATHDEGSTDVKMDRSDADCERQEGVKQDPSSADLLSTLNMDTGVDIDSSSSSMAPSTTVKVPKKAKKRAKKSDELEDRSEPLVLHKGQEVYISPLAWQAGGPREEEIKAAKKFGVVSRQAVVTHVKEKCGMVELLFPTDFAADEATMREHLGKFLSIYKGTALKAYSDFTRQMFLLPLTSPYISLEKP